MGSKKTLLFIIIFSLATFALPGIARAAVLINPSPAVQNLGSVLQTTRLSRQLMYKMSNGDVHLTLLYADYNGDPTQFLDINLTQPSHQYYLKDVAPGFPSIHGNVFYPNDKLYLATGDPGNLIEFDPKTGATRFIHKTASDRDFYSAAIGNDGVIYYGESTKGGMDSYDPINDIFTAHGIMDPANTSSLIYNYAIGSDGKYVFNGIGQSPWYLVVYNLETKEKINYWKDQNDTSGEVRAGINGTWYYRRGSPTIGTLWYKFDSNGVPQQLASAPAASSLKDTATRGNLVQDQSQFSKYYGFEVNLDKAIPSNTNNAVIQWRQTGTTQWQSLTVTEGFHLAPVAIKRLYKDPSVGKLFGVAEAYMPVFSYDTLTQQATILGYPQYSLYNGMYVNGYWYIGGYTNAMLKYDPTKPWTLTNSTINQYDKTINPYKLPNIPGSNGASGPKYQYYTALGADGFLYVGGKHLRDSTGGDLGWYDLIQETVGHNREDFASSLPNDVIAVNNGQQILYSGGTSLIYFDVTTKKVIKTFTPITNQNAGVIVEISPGQVVGVIAPSTIYSLNVNTGVVNYVKTYTQGKLLGNTQAYDRDLVKGPDGYVWLLVDDTKVARINPADGAVEIITSLPGAQENIVFYDNDAYVFGNRELFKISNIFTASKLGDANNDNKVDGIDYIVWLNHYNQNVGGQSNGDFNNSGKVDGVDYVIWLSNYGK